MDQHYTKAMSLFQEGAYEEAIEEMVKSQTVSPEDFKKFVEQCNGVIAEQYKYLINEALSNRNYTEANRLREEFVNKHGHNAAIDALPIPQTTSVGPSSPANPVNSGTGSTAGANTGVKKMVIGALAVAVVVVIGIIISLAVNRESVTENTGENWDAADTNQVDSIQIVDDEDNSSTDEYSASEGNGDDRGYDESGESSVSPTVMCDNYDYYTTGEMRGTTPTTLNVSLDKGKVVLNFNYRLEAEMNILLYPNGEGTEPEIELKGQRYGEQFIITNSGSIQTLLKYLSRGDFLLRYQYLEEGARHYGWNDFYIGRQFLQATAAYKKLNP